MKRVLLVVLSGMLAFMLTACGENANKKAESTTTSEASQKADEGTAAKATEETTKQEGMDTGAAAKEAAPAASEEPKAEEPKAEEPKTEEQKQGAAQ